MAPLANPIDIGKVNREHFGRRIEVRDGGCWIWTGQKGAGGYGVYRLDGRKYLAHRISMALYLERDLAPGEVIDHDNPEVGCSVRLCVNPAHLVVTDVRGNNATKAGRKYIAALGEECQRGHDLTLPNATYPTNRGVGCRRCQRIKSDESRDRMMENDPAAYRSKVNERAKAWRERTRGTPEAAARKERQKARERARRAALRGTPEGETKRLARNARLRAERAARKAATDV